MSVLNSNKKQPLEFGEVKGTAELNLGRPQTFVKEDFRRRMSRAGK